MRGSGYSTRPGRLNSGAMPDMPSSPKRYDGVHTPSRFVCLLNDELIRKLFSINPRFRYTSSRLLADKDIGNITSYTIQRFGIRQARLYRDGLFKAFEMISDFPFIGSDQSQIKKNIRRQVYESHSIYYRVDVNEVFILRILGPGEDPLKHLK